MGCGSVRTTVASKWACSLKVWGRRIKLLATGTVIRSKREEPRPCLLRVMKRQHSSTLCPSASFSTAIALRYITPDKTEGSHTRLGLTACRRDGNLKIGEIFLGIVIFPHRSQYQLKLNRSLGIQPTVMEPQDGCTPIFGWTIHLDL